MKENHQRTGTVPYGWNAVAAIDRQTGSVRTSKTGRQADNLVPHAQEQATLRRILRWHAEAWSDNAIARQLNSEGITAKQGGKWYGATVASIRRHARLDDGGLSQVA